MQIMITQKGTVTKLTKPELARMRNVTDMLTLLARHQPKSSEYGMAAEAMVNVLALWSNNDVRTEDRDDTRSDAPDTGESLTDGATCDDEAMVGVDQVAP